MYVCVCVCVCVPAYICESRCCHTKLVSVWVAAGLVDPFTEPVSTSWVPGFMLAGKVLEEEWA